MLPPDWWISALQCPEEGAELEPNAGAYRCRNCRRDYPVDDGILRLLPDRSNVPERDDLEAERRQRDREADGYDRLLGLRLLSRWEIPWTLGPLELRSDDAIMEVGCGTGRMTLPLLSCGARVIALDHSLQSLRELRKKLPPVVGDRLLLVQGDAARLPVRSGWATRLLSSQMLEHLPGDGLRERAVAEMARVLASGGRAAISAYWHVPWLRGVLRKEGRHSGEIYYHRFTRDELAELLEPHFSLERMTGRLLYVLLFHGRRAPARGFTNS